MAERRSPGAESSALFGQTLDRLLAGSAYDPAVLDRVLGAVRAGSSTIAAVAETTGFALPLVEGAVRVLAARGVLVLEPTPLPPVVPDDKATTSAKPAPRRRRQPPVATPGKRVAKTG